MRYLVTGGSGFIGSNLRENLLAEGHEVVNLDISEEADLIADLSKINWSELELGKIDGVVHLGAKTSVPESISKPGEYHLTNVEGSKGLFEWCNKSRVPVVVFASSAAVYGDSISEIKKVGEEGGLGSPYAETKLLGEKLAKEYSSEHTRFVCLRFFNVYGPGQTVDSNYGAVIPSFISRAWDSEDLEIFGDGKQTRDFVHVQDVCRAIIGSLQKDIGNFAVINVGSGEGVSIENLAKKIVLLAKENGLNMSQVIYKGSREGDVEHSIADMKNLDSLMDIGKMIRFEDGLADLFTIGIR